MATSNLGITELTTNQTGKTVTINNALEQLDNATQGKLAIVFTTNARTLTGSEYTNNFIFVAGTLTGSGTLTVPLTERFFAVDNSASGHALVVGGASGGTVTVASGSLGLIYCDGTDCVALGGASGGSVTARDKGVGLAQWVSGAIVADGTIYFAFKTPYSGTVDSLDYFTGNGSFTVAVKINGTNVTGLSAVSVSSSTPANAAATAAKTFAAGDKITGVISSATSNPTDALLNLNMTWT